MNPRRSNTQRPSAWTRRRFLGVGGGALAGLVAGCSAASDLDASAGPTATPGASPTAPSSTEPSPTDMVAPSPAVTAPGVPLVDPARRVLVVVQLAGGNDALDTVAPIGDGRYYDLRPTLALEAGDVGGLGGAPDLGLHPALAPLIPAYDAGRLAIAQSVGLPGQSRSHFVAMDAWWSAMPGTPARTGWLGRWLDLTLDAETVGGEQNPLRAVAVGGGSPALAAERARSTVITSPAMFGFGSARRPLPDEVVDAFLATAASGAATSSPATSSLATSSLLAAAQAAVTDTGSAVEMLSSILTGDDGTANATFGQGSVTELLQTAAGIVELDAGTRIVVVGAGGFDTHADERSVHDGLLTDVGNGLAAFVERLESSGHAARVCVLTTSEFGRRVAENGSGGTDHGQAGTQMLWGPAVAGGRVIGDVDLADLDDGDLRIEIDARSLYAAALDWLSGADGSADEALGGSYDRYGLVGV